MQLNSIVQLFTSFVPGLRLVDGGELLEMANQLFSTKAGLTALAGGGQAGATPLPAAINEVAVVAADNDSAMLPLAVPGAWCFVINDGAHSLQVFGNPANPNNGGAGDTIAPYNSVVQNATAVGVAQVTVKAALYVCFTAGKWKQFLSA